MPRAMPKPDGPELIFAHTAILVVSALLAAPAGDAMTLTSPDIQPGGAIAPEQAFDGAQRPGRNASPALA